jgi:hypothetical protein
VALRDTNSLMNFADDNMVVCLITNNNESAYKEDVSEQALWHCGVMTTTCPSKSAKQRS